MTFFLSLGGRGGKFNDGVFKYQLSNTRKIEFYSSFKCKKVS